MNNLPNSKAQRADCFHATFSFMAQHPGACRIGFDDYEIKAYGFSKCGAYFVIATSSNLTIFRKGEQTMAIDGVGILDSDLAYDVYNHIMELYHCGEPIESIKNMISKFHLTYYGMDFEIVTAAYTLAMWKIGELTTAQLKDIRDIAAKGASSQWNDVHSGAQEARQRVLHEFLRKIEQPNLKIKKRKKYKKLSSLFPAGDVLSIKINNRYRCVIFDRFYQCGLDAYYSFVVTTYNSDTMPTTENILFENIPVTKKTNTGAYGIRTLDIHYKSIEKHYSDFLKSGIIHLDTKAEKLGFSRQISGFDGLQDLEKEMDDILLGEKIELYVCCLCGN